MGQCIAIIEGNHEGLVSQKQGARYGAAEGFADCLKELDQSLHFRIIRPHFADHLYHDGLLEGCDGIVFTGAANNWSADEALAAPARQMMALALDSHQPVFGSCYGMQLAVTVLGGKNQSNPRETEFAIARDITLSQEGRRHPLYNGKAPIFDARCMHRDDVAQLPEGAVSLSQNAHSAHQAIAYETGGICFWGVQYHPELQFHDIANYIENNDVDSFADAKRFARRLSLEIDIAEITADFRALSFQKDEAYQKNEALIAKYQLSEALIDDGVHRCELQNFLSRLAGLKA